MGKIYYLMGKSASGKDTLYEELFKIEDLKLHRIIMYTTRPIREKETDGCEYHFVNDKEADRLLASGRVIELRTYDTIHGLWRYFTVADEQIDPSEKDYLAIGTLVSYQKLRDYYGAGIVVPIYIEVEDGLRLERALKRERKPQNQKYEEMCRRFLADAADYAEENIRNAGIERRFYNNEDRSECLAEIAEFIRREQKGE
ncbi:MAG: guanylate kinase [Eubacteriales bacterium]|nr:guanylate kinase [Eubacteriales bacterium]